MNLESNNLSGTLFASLGNSFPKLEILDLKSNTLAGQIPDFAALDQTPLTIDLRLNMLYGNLPGLYNMQISEFKVSDNRLIGTIPV